MAKGSKSKQERLRVVWTRLEEPDVIELERRERETGAPVAAQVRILVHKALRARRVIS